MEFKLVVVGGKANKGAVTLNPPAVIGRSRQAELTVAHPMISRRHCEIFEADGLLMIRDLGSLNGTVVEGQRIQESPLCPGNEFCLGPLTFRVEYEYQGDLDALPAPKIAAQAAPQPEASSDSCDEEVPNFEPVGETPRVPVMDRPADQRPRDLQVWDQAATEFVGRPDKEEAVVEIEELVEVEDQPEQEPEPTPPPPPRLRRPAAGDPPQHPTAGADQGLDDFLKQLP
jgi:predicted component of type VI protein secretion system